MINGGFLTCPFNSSPSVSAAKTPHPVTTLHAGLADLVYVKNSLLLEQLHEPRPERLHAV